MSSAVVASVVAVVWTHPDSARAIDTPILEPQAHPLAWLTSMGHADRLDLCDANRVQTQALLGDYVEVDEEQGDFARVIIPNQLSHKERRGYPGWIARCQLVPPPSSYLHHRSHARVLSPKAWLRDDLGKRLLELSFGTQLPVLDLDGPRVRVQTPRRIGWLGRRDVHLSDEAMPDKGYDLLETGQRFVGLPYLWGGTSAFGFDCSGFVHLLHRAHGIGIPRDASEQSTTGLKIPLDELRAGDLLFFGRDEGRGPIHHVGMSAGGRTMLHAPRTGRSIEMRQLDGSEYAPELCVARRYTERTPRGRPLA